jgi:hypothetical protein
LNRQGHSIRRECRNLDGIDYEIVVLATSGGILARWECKACGASVVNPLAQPTEPEALALAYDSLNNHHLREHPTVRPSDYVGPKGHFSAGARSPNGSKRSSEGD